MEKVTIESLPSPDPPFPTEQFTPLSRALELEELAINHYVLSPGDQFGFAIHRHHDQEEVFIVLEGTATFHTPEEEIDVSAGEAIRFAPGEFQLGRNDGDEDVVALALGAPAGSSEIDHYRHCPECGEETIQRLERTEDALVVTCESCNTVTERASRS